MSKEFPITIDFARGLAFSFWSQFFVSPVVPTQSFANKTVIVTGSNVGLGLEAARHFYRLKCAKLILAVRTIAKGEAAKEDIIQSTKHRFDADAIEVWPLDVSDTESTLAFVERVNKELPRLDIVVENAGMKSHKWSLAEGFERTVQVNTLNTFLIALLLLPKLNETKAKFADASPRLEIVTSDGHRFTTFEEINAPDLYQRLNDQGLSGVEPMDFVQRYSVSKLITILLMRELVSRLKVSKSSEPPPVIITLVDPGFAHSTIDREGTLVERIAIWFIALMFGRSTEAGSRALVNGVCTGPEAHGEFMTDNVVRDAAEWIYSDMGKRAQQKVFEQTMEVMEARKPGVGKSAGL